MSLPLIKNGAFRRFSHQSLVAVFLDKRQKMQLHYRPLDTYGNISIMRKPNARKSRRQEQILDNVCSPQKMEGRAAESERSSPRGAAKQPFATAISVRKMAIWRRGGMLRSGP